MLLDRFYTALAESLPGGTVVRKFGPDFTGLRVWFANANGYKITEWHDGLYMVPITATTPEKDWSKEPRWIQSGTVENSQHLVTRDVGTLVVMARPLVMQRTAAPRSHFTR